MGCLAYAFDEILVLDNITSLFLILYIVYMLRPVV